MKSIGVIAEFNPFHEGHKHLIEETSASIEADVCISVISGNFTQRGGPAYFDKWKRAEDAVRDGFDLVVAMPQVFSCASANYFAAAGTMLLDLMGCDYLSFGSELGDIDELTDIVKAIDSLESNRDILARYLNKGLSFPKARSEALKELYPNIDVNPLEEPNNILAIEYLLSIEKNNLGLKPFTVSRKKGDYMTSGTVIREGILNDKYIGQGIRSMEKKYFDIIKYLILSKDTHELESFDSSGEGLGNKLKKELQHSADLEDFISRVSGKRYTYTRISRLLTQILLGIKPEMLKKDVFYIRPLAMNEKGASFLKDCKKNRSINIIDDVAECMKYSEDDDLKSFLTIDIKSQDIYNALTERDLYENSEYVKSPIILQSQGF